MHLSFDLNFVFFGFIWKQKIFRGDSTDMNIIQKIFTSVLRHSQPTSRYHPIETERRKIFLFMIFYDSSNSHMTLKLFVNLRHPFIVCVYVVFQKIISIVGHVTGLMGAYGTIRDNNISRYLIVMEEHFQWLTILSFPFSIQLICYAYYYVTKKIIFARNVWTKNILKHFHKQNSFEWMKNKTFACSIQITCKRYFPQCVCSLYPSLCSI